jgi:hypothetical protein
VWFDHVPIAVKDLDEACTRFSRQYGLGCGGGGRHPQGTVSRAIPVSSTEYVELLAVDDRAGDWSAEVTAALERGEPLLGWSIEVDDIDAVAARLGGGPGAGQLELEDGTVGMWR